MMIYDDDVNTMFMTSTVPQRPKSKSSTKKTHPTTETEPSKANVMKSSGKTGPSAIEVDGDVDGA